MLRSSRRLLLLAVGFIVFQAQAVSTAFAQKVEKPQSKGAVKVSRQLSNASSPFAGRWLYRSFISDPFESDPSKPLDDLLFGQGNLVIAVDGAGKVTGNLGGDGWNLTLSGTTRAGDPPTIQFQGRGIISREEWVYDYIGYAVPKWPAGVDQRPAIVGTIIRTVPHTNGQAQAGYVAHWIAVQSEPEADLRQFEAEWAAAVLMNDPDKVDRFFARPFVFVGPQGVVQTREQHLDDFRTGKLRVTAMNIAETTFTINPGVAIVNVRAKVEGTYDGRSINGDYNFQDTVRTVQGRWRAVARKQSKPLPTAVTSIPTALPSQTSTEASALPADRAFAARLQQCLEAAPLRQLQTLVRSVGANDQLLPAAQRLSLARTAAAEFANPPTATPGSDGNILLDVKYSNKPFGSLPVRLHLRTYNGELVGPTIRAAAGSTVRVRLLNSLPPEPTPIQHQDGHHAWNTTNLHTHGLHVKPQADPDSTTPALVESDNVLLDVAPGAQQLFAFEIPPDHPAGTFWYHGHRHGSTSAHVSSGMAGALIVSRGTPEPNLSNIDIVPEIQAAMQSIGGRDREKILVMQQVPFVISNNRGEIELRNNPDDLFGNNTWHRSGHHTTVSGQLLPVMRFTPGEVQRWRMIHSGVREVLKLQLEKDPDPAIGGSGPDHIEFHQIAVDGLALDRVERLPEIELFPGYRSDAIVKAPSTKGVYYLIDAASPSGKSLLGEAEPLKFIAKIVIVDEPPVNMGLPTDAQVTAHRLMSLPDPAKSDPIQQTYYGIVSTPAGTTYVIGDTDPGLGQPVQGRPYSQGTTKHLTLGKTERWRIGTRNSPGIGATHPFHIHVNPFELVRIWDNQNRPVPTARVWRDTLAMQQDYTYELVTRNADFRGTFVQHCHILDHEDRGMMQTVTIDDVGPRSLSMQGLENQVDRRKASPVAVVAPDTREAERTNGAAQTDRTRVMFFVKGSFCPHCMAQLSEMAKQLAEQDVEVVVVSASTADDLQEFPPTPFRLIADPDLELFKAHRIFEAQTRHATIVLDIAGREVFRDAVDRPLTEASSIIKAIQSSRVATKG